MDPIIQDFEADLDKIVSHLDFIEVLRHYAGYSPTPDDLENNTAFIQHSKNVHQRSQAIHSNLPLASGTLILYTCGRFEAMTRTLFEDLCQRLVTRASAFSRLPKKMRENLPLFTAKVISEPRKYGHAENGVRAFVTTLAANLEPGAQVSRVNHECLSITDSNMRADMLGELFGRVGASKFWIQISEQAAIKAFFQESESSKVEQQAKRKLDELMDIRNRIAHPSGEFQWPSIDTLKSYIHFLRLLGRSMADLVTVFEVTLCIADTMATQTTPTNS